MSYGKMWKALVAGIVFSILISGCGSTASGSSGEYAVTAHISCDENWIFSKYDVNVYFDGNREGTIAHGNSSDFQFQVDAGTHTISFSSKDDSSVVGSASIDVSVDTELSYQIHCFSDKIDVDTIWEDKKIQLADDETKMKFSAEDYKAKVCGDVVQDLKSQGFTKIDTNPIYDLNGGWLSIDGKIESISINGNTSFASNDVFKKDAQINIIYHTLKLPQEQIEAKIRENIGKPAVEVLASMEETSYKLFFNSDGKTVSKDNLSGYILDSGSLDTENERAYLTVITVEQKELRTQLEQNFPREMAKRAAVVVITNSQAEDVFKDNDGNAYDPSKFHSYSDISGYFMVLVDEGEWSAVDHQTWHVNDIRLRIFGYDTYVKASFNIYKQGDGYIAYDVYKVSGDKNKIDDGKTYTTDHLEPSDDNPFLTVPISMVEEDRDEAAVIAMENEIKAYDKWAGDQFSSGSNKQMEKMIKNWMNDEKSYKHIKTTSIKVESDEIKKEINSLLKSSGYSSTVDIKDIFIYTQFSEKNIFNATVKRTAIGIADYSEKKTILVGIS